MPFSGHTLIYKPFRARFVALISVIVLAAFLVLQAASVSHAHFDHVDHDEHEPPHAICDICVVTTSEEDGLSVSAITPSLKDVPSFMDCSVTFEALCLASAVKAPGLETLGFGHAPPRDPDLRADEARAPPL